MTKPAQTQPNEQHTGAWYMYFFETKYKEGPWGLQGDVQFRNWDLIGDLEQLLLRGGLTYQPKTADIKFTLGYAHITSGTYGHHTSTNLENRIYQEALYSHLFGTRFYSTHRFRYEQRFIENQNFRTRYRYNFFLNIPLNKVVMEKNSIYLALYNELFINGQRNIGNGHEVELFDRNRFYAALGYMPFENLKIQLGWMNQSTDPWSKNQLQLSFHHQF